MKKIYITETQKNEIFSSLNEGNDNVVLLNEENKGQKKKCVENIINNTPSIIRGLLDVELTRLPPRLKTMLNPDGALFKAVSNNQTGANKFIDYLRLNLYQQFGIGRNSNLTQFIPGISRIACTDCRFYAFDLSIEGGKILELSRVLRLIDRKPEYMLSDINLDSDLNGLSYNELMDLFSDKMKTYVSNTRSALSSNEYKITKTSDYTIIPIEDEILDRGGMKVLVPTDYGRMILNGLAAYTDWCVCGDRYANEEFSQYLSNGGKMYVCLKNGFENIKRPETTKTALDEYGLSMICVIVGEDGLPTNVTTRYNHDFGGENHSEMWEATHLQKVLNVNYYKVFKPRPKNDLRKLHLAEDKKPSAQDQVNGRVNAGILDSVCSCGMIGEESLDENQNDRLANEYIKKHLNLEDFNDIRKFALQVCHAIPNVRYNKNYYLLGVVRLIISEKLKGKHLSELNNILNSIRERGEEFDRNLDGISFIDLYNEYYEDEIIGQTESVQKVRTTPNGYIIKHIETYEESTNSGPEDWCITYEEEYFYSVVDCGDCIYIVENPSMMANVDMNSQEFKVACRKMGDPHFDDMAQYGSGEPPYDNFGLSRFVVLVNPSYIQVYSRWNMPNELDGRFLNREELEEIVGMPFNEAFPYIKPNKLTDEQRAFLYEGAEPESDEYTIGAEGGNNDYFHIINENDSENDEFKSALEPIAKFMKNEGLNVYPFPEVELNWDEQDGLFITTGYYLPSEKKIVLFCKDRHPKDILRSYSHEMIHHMQNLNGDDLNFTSSDDVKDNKKLEKLESEAYLKGNIYFRKWTEYERKNKQTVLSERIISKSELRELTSDYGVVEYLSPSEVDLSSFNIKSNLNPKFWKNGKLDSRIRMKLLDIADDFIDFLGVDWVKPEDITITGSLANYNWNKQFSDIDLHVIMDFSKVDKKTEFVEQYFSSQKNLWNDEHKELTIFGFQVEVYVQDISQLHTSSGVYSLEKNDWIVEPERDKLAKVKVNKTHIKNIVSKYTKKIDLLYNKYNDANGDKHKIEIIREKAEALFDKLKTERRVNLKDADNEINEGNIIFKSLRRLGYIEKLYNLINKGYNELNSLP